MNNVPAIALLCAVITAQCSAQYIAVQPDGSTRPQTSFSNIVPERTAWVVTAKKPWEFRTGKSAADPAEESYLSKFASTTVKRIESSYAGGVRREEVLYANGSKLVRYLTKGLVLYEDPVTGEPVLDDAANASPNLGAGPDRLGELGWVSDRYYIGTANCQGKPCYVYRQYEPQSPAGRQDDDATANDAGVPAAELANAKTAKVIATAFIDKETMRPVAYETLYEVWLYETGRTFREFTLPPGLRKALQEQGNAEEHRKQKYNIRQ